MIKNEIIDNNWCSMHREYHEFYAVHVYLRSIRISLLSTPGIQILLPFKSITKLVACESVISLFTVTLYCVCCITRPVCKRFICAICMGNLRIMQFSTIFFNMGIRWPVLVSLYLTHMFIKYYYYFF